MTAEAKAQLNEKDLIVEYRLTHDGDAWGNCMHWWFHVADEIHFNRPALRVPDEWAFRPSPLGPQNDPEEYTTWAVQHATDAALESFGAKLHRLAGILKSAGKDY